MRLWVIAPKAKIGHGPLSFILLACIVVALLATSVIATALVTDKTVQVFAWDRTVQLHDPGDTVADALSAAAIVLAPGDRVTPGLESLVKNGMSITVERAEPVFVMKDGYATTLLTAEKTVTGVLSLAGVTPGNEDVVVPSEGQEIPVSGLVKVVAVTYDDVIEDMEIPFTTDRRDDSSIEAGLSRVYSTGKPGVSRITYKARYEDGIEVSRIETSREDLVEPKSQVVLVGTLTQVSRGGEDFRFERALEVVASAYCPCTKCCGPSATGYTATGLPAKEGVIAVDPRVIPLGSRVYIDGYGYALAGDTGSAIKGNRIDVCFTTHDEALAWGLKRTKVYVVE